MLDIFLGTVPLTVLTPPAPAHTATPGSLPPLMLLPHLHSLSIPPKTQRFGNAPAVTNPESTCGTGIQDVPVLLPRVLSSPSSPTPLLPSSQPRAGVASPPPTSTQSDSPREAVTNLTARCAAITARFDAIESHIEGLAALQGTTQRTLDYSVSLTTLPLLLSPPSPGKSNTSLLVLISSVTTFLRSHRDSHLRTAPSRRHRPHQPPVNLKADFDSRMQLHIISWNASRIRNYS